MARSASLIGPEVRVTDVRILRGDKVIGGGYVISRTGSRAHMAAVEEASHWIETHRLQAEIRETVIESSLNTAVSIRETVIGEDLEAVVRWVSEVIDRCGSYCHFDWERAK